MTATRWDEQLGSQGGFKSYTSEKTLHSTLQFNLKLNQAPAKAPPGYLATNIDTGYVTE